MTTAPRGEAGAGAELGRMLATLAHVVVVTGGILIALGATPAWLSGETRAVRGASSIDEAERRLGSKVLLPAYFPERVGWPPAEVRVAGGKGGAVRLVLAARDGGAPLELLQSVSPGAPVAPALLEGRNVLRSSRTTVGAHPATLSAVIVAGETWEELAWEVQGRATILRTRGAVDELYRMARSVHAEGGR